MLSSLNLKLQNFDPDTDDDEMVDMVIVKTGSGYINHLVTDQPDGHLFKTFVTFPYLFPDIR